MVKLYRGAEQPKVHPTGPVSGKSRIEILEDAQEILNTTNMPKKDLTLSSQVLITFIDLQSESAHGNSH
jgi:hypothetical protein